jgi:hypothetical protein
MADTLFKKYLSNHFYVGVTPCDQWQCEISTIEKFSPELAQLMTESANNRLWCRFNTHFDKIVYCLQNGVCCTVEKVDDKIVTTFQNNVPF